MVRIRALLKLVERASPAIIERIPIAGIKIDQSRDVFGVSASD